jgi:hypothetical protein
MARLSGFTQSISWSWVAAFAVVIGLTSIAKARAPAHNRNRVCVGVIGGSLDGYDVSGRYGGCSFDGTTTMGKKILAVCPEGSRCRIAAYGTWGLGSSEDEHASVPRTFFIKKVQSVRRV